MEIPNIYRNYRSGEFCSNNNSATIRWVQEANFKHSNNHWWSPDHIAEDGNNDNNNHKGVQEYRQNPIFNKGNTNSYSSCEIRRKNATRESTTTLKNWLQEHIRNPYPSKGEKIMLAIITKMTLTQVSTWFANARRRLKKENKVYWLPRNRSVNDNNNNKLDNNNDLSNDLFDDVDKRHSDVTNGNHGQIIVRNLRRGAKKRHPVDDDEDDVASCYDDDDDDDDDDDECHGNERHEAMARSLSDDDNKDKDNSHLKTNLNMSTSSQSTGAQISTSQNLQPSTYFNNDCVAAPESEPAVKGDSYRLGYNGLTSTQRFLAIGENKPDTKPSEPCDWSIFPFFAGINSLPSCKFASLGIPRYNTYTGCNNSSIEVDNGCDQLTVNRSSLPTLVSQPAVFGGYRVDDHVLGNKSEVVSHSRIPHDYSIGPRLNQSAFFKPYAAQSCATSKQSREPIKIPGYPSLNDLEMRSSQGHDKPKIWSLADVAAENFSERIVGDDEDGHDDDCKIINRHNTNGYEINIDDDADDDDDDDYDDGVVEETVVDNDASSSWTSSSSSLASSSSSSPVQNVSS